MRIKTAKVLSKAVQSILIFGASLYPLVYIGLALARMNYPFELEWMEGGSLDHVRRVLEGRPLYVAPTLDFVPYIYSPMYFYTSAALVAASDLSFFPLRLVSFSASLGCFALIFLIAKKLANSTFGGFISLGLFAACFEIGGGWLDLARVDSLALFFILAAVLVVYTTESGLSPIFVAFLIALAYLSKQSTLFIAAPIVLYCLLKKTSYGVVLLSISGLSIGAATLILDWLHHGWYTYYTVELPSQHTILPRMLVHYWIEDLLEPLPIAVGAAAWVIFYWLRRRKNDAILLLLFAGGMVSSSWLSRLHSGGYDNVLLPAYAAVAILFGLAVSEIRRVAAKLQDYRRDWLTTAIYGLTALQFALLIYNPFSHLPTREDRKAGEAIVRELATIVGPVWVFNHGYLATRAGKPSGAHMMAVNDVLRGRKHPAKQALVTQLSAALQNRDFNALLVDSDFPTECPKPRPKSVTGINWFCQDVHENYKESRSLLENADVFWPTTGARRRPEFLYLPNTELMTDGAS